VAAARGANLKSEAVVADVAKQLKVIEGHFATGGIEVKKANFKKATRAGGVPFSVLDAVRLNSDKLLRGGVGAKSHAKSMGFSAEMGRVQLRQLKLKTKVAEEEAVVAENDGEDGEEGEEGAKEE